MKFTSSPMSRSRFLKTVLMGGFVVFPIVPGLFADVSLPALFSDRVVLQASAKTPVWGKAAPGEAVVITLGAARANTTAGADGKWRVNLDLGAVGKGPFELKVQGRNQLVVSDVLVGQVWLCSGQSNMEWPLRGSDGSAAEIAKSANTQLRQFKVDRVTAVEPVEEAKGKWVIADPATSAEFTAVGYYFGKMLQRELDAPVGLINSAWGGTPVEAWMRRESFDVTPDLKAGAAKARADAVAFKDFVRNYNAWMKANAREDRGVGSANNVATSEAFNAFAADTSGWKTVTLPASLSSQGLPDAGAVWLCRKITLPAGAVGAGIQVHAGEVRDAVKIYWNGVLVGEGGIEATNNRYGLHQKNVTSVEGVLALRIFAPSAGLGMVTGDKRFRLDYKGGSIQLAGEWQAKAEYAFSEPASGAAAIPVKPVVPYPDHFVAAYLFNAMIHPLMPFAISGAIWDQGSQNADRAEQYRTSFPTMIADWRKQWGQGDFPFYFAQLANFQPRPEKPWAASTWTDIRESQAAGLALPNTGMAVLIDVGDANNIHPGDKKSEGERFARLALAGTYGKKIVANGPTFASVKFDGGKARVAFNSNAMKLVAKPVSGELGTRPQSEVQGFVVCGDDRKWSWAEARIEGLSLVVWSNDVPKPIAVRYAWADNPVCNLFNDGDLPAGPFRSDAFPLSTVKNKY